MQNLLQDLVTLLEQDDRFVIEGQLFKNKVIELALALDSSLIRLLLSSDGIRSHFFQDVDGILVFDKIKFQQFVSNKAFLPDSYTAFKNKIGLTAEGSYLTDSKEVVLSWPYKDCVLEGGQTKEDARRNEAFWNETLAPDQIDRLLAPKILTNFKKYDESGKQEVRSLLGSDDNLIIKGNNLLVLHTLKQVYVRRVKLIYIDPPYNTGSDDFLYNDSFSQSTWLTFMKNRIEIAKSLLADDGVFVMQLSDHRVAEGKILLDEAFGRENFINQVTVKTRSPSGFKTVNLGVFETAEYLYFYAAKNKKSVSYKPQYVISSYDNNYKYVLEKTDDDLRNWVITGLDSIISNELGFGSVRDCKKSLGDGAFEIKMAEYALANSSRVFRYTEINDDASKEAVVLRNKSKIDPETIYKLGEGHNEIFIRGGKQIYFYDKKVRDIDGVRAPTMLLTNIWTDISWEGIASEGGVKLKQGKKPERLIKRILDMYTQQNDIVLDFFAGSGTTVAVAHKMKRRWIAIEQMDYMHELPEARLIRVIDGEKSGISKVVKWEGGGSFVYCELTKANQAFVEQIQGAENSERLTSIWQMMQGKAFLSYRIDPKKIDLASADFTVLSLDDQKRFLIEVMDKNMLYVAASEIDDISYRISDEDKKLNRQFFGEI
jgi:adenine-specific DNA-methyltransferase